MEASIFRCMAWRVYIMFAVIGLLMKNIRYRINKVLSYWLHLKQHYIDAYLKQLILKIPHTKRPWSTRSKISEYPLRRINRKPLQSCKISVQFTLYRRCQSNPPPPRHFIKFISSAGRLLLPAPWTPGSLDLFNWKIRFLISIPLSIYPLYNRILTPGYPFWFSCFISTAILRWSASHFLNLVNEQDYEMSRSME